MIVRNLKIEANGPVPKVMIDGTDIAQYVSRLVLNMEAGEVPEVELTIPICDGIEADIDAIIKIAEERDEGRQAEETM